MPECDTRIRLQNQADSANTVDQYVRGVITAGGNAGHAGAALAEYVYRQLGDAVAATGAHANKSGFERWAEQTLNSTQLLALNQRQTKYAGVTYRLWPGLGSSNPGGATRILSPTMRVGRTWIGLDKLGHFFQQGYEYWEYVQRGHTLAQAREWGHQTEAALGVQPGGLRPSPYGLGTTGVYSRADQVANEKGYEFYAALAGGTLGQFSVAGYVDDQWSEEVNLSAYHGDIVAEVWSNLLAGRWTGSFAMQHGTSTYHVYIVGDLTPAASAGISLPVTGRFRYSSPDDPRVDVQLTGTVTPRVLVHSSLGYRGIQIDFDWTSGANTGRGRWRSARDSEQVLVGNWGWNASRTNGGHFNLRK